MVDIHIIYLCSAVHPYGLLYFIIYGDRLNLFSKITKKMLEKAMVKRPLIGIQGIRVIFN